MKQLILYTACCLIIFSCSNQSTQQPLKTVPDSTVTQQSFFPVTSFLKGQFRILDSTPVTIMHVSVQGNKTDTTWLKREMLKPIFQAFTQYQITETNMISFFKESKFNDQTINAITFTYNPISTLPDSIHLRHWDVYINPEKGTVSKVYITTQSTVDKKVFTNQLTWQTDRWAKITEFSLDAAGKTAIIRDDKFIWGFD